MKRFVLIGLFLLCASPAFALTGSLDNSVLDAALAKIATGTRFTWCTAMPANYAGIAAVTKANITVTAGSGNGDFLIAAGSVSGRKVTLLAQTSITLTGNGTVTHQCVDDGTTLLACLPLGTSKTITDYTTEAWDSAAVDIELRAITGVGW
jgi:hypothetical protein